MIARFALGCALAACALPAVASEHSAIDTLVAQHAKIHGIPESLVHRIIQRESGYNPRAVNRSFLGLMQISYATARGMGYTGPASGLLDADTNLTYAVPYLANAYKVAGGNPNRAVALYASGYYYEAKRKGLVQQLRNAASDPVSTGSIPAASPVSFFQRSAAFTPNTDR
jgi:soluble lytic murein transglycosylase-like protein